MAIYLKAAKIIHRKGGNICPVMCDLVTPGKMYKLEEFWLFAPRRRQHNGGWFKSREERVTALLFCHEMKKS